MLDLWNSLNQRQQTYLRLIYEQDQTQERAEKARSARDWSHVPAKEWRCIWYANEMYGYTPLKQAIKEAGYMDPGTGSTFQALEERGLIETVSHRVNPHRRSDLSVQVWLTAKGRKVARAGLAIKTPARLPVGTLREWHWKALCRAYVRGDDGFGYDRDDGDGFGYVSWNTVLRLRDYTVKGQEKPLVASMKFYDQPHTEMVGGYSFSYDHTWRMCITGFGKLYYCQNYQRYRDLYPDVNAPEP